MSTMKPTVLILLCLFLVAGCDRDPTETSNGTWEHEKFNLTDRLGFGELARATVTTEVENRLWSSKQYELPASAKVRVFCNGKEKKSPDNELDFIIEEIQRRPAQCLVEISNKRKTSKTDEPTFRRIRLTYQEDKTWIMEISTFTPSASWMD